MLVVTTWSVAQVEHAWMPMSSLGEACAAGDIRSIAHLLDSGASVNDFIVSGFATLLYITSGKGHVEAPRALVALGAAVNQADVCQL